MYFVKTLFTHYVFRLKKHLFLHWKFLIFLTNIFLAWVYHKLKS